MRYQIIDQGVVVEVTNSFSQAIAWAKVGEYSVFDTKIRRLIYDGYTDDFNDEAYKEVK